MDMFYGIVGDGVAHHDGYNVLLSILRQKGTSAITNVDQEEKREQKSRLRCNDPVQENYRRQWCNFKVWQ